LKGDQQTEKVNKQKKCHPPETLSIGVFSFFCQSDFIRKFYILLFLCLFLEKHQTDQTDRPHPKKIKICPKSSPSATIYRTPP
jgi:hypothetical protein